jgi:hypothetical protein
MKTVTRPHTISAATQQKTATITTMVNVVPAPESEAGVGTNTVVGCVVKWRAATTGVVSVSVVAVVISATS